MYKFDIKNVCFLSSGYCLKIYDYNLIVDCDGNILFKTHYDIVDYITFDFEDNPFYLILKKDNKYILVVSNQVVFENCFEDFKYLCRVENSHCLFFAFKENDKWGIITDNNETVIKAEYGEIIDEYHRGVVSLKKITYVKILI